MFILACEDAKTQTHISQYEKKKTYITNLITYEVANLT